MAAFENTDILDFDLPDMDLFADEVSGFCRVGRAIKTVGRTAARRARSEAHLAEILPAEIEVGSAWHVISAGDIDSLSFLAHLLKARSLDYVAFSTWCMAMDDVESIEKWITEGRIGRIDAYVGEIFPGSYSREYVALCDVVRATGGRVCVFRNHSKVQLCRSGDHAWVVESSANINTNPRCENTVITADIDLYFHHKSYFDSIRSFNRDFDAWVAM